MVANPVGGLDCQALNLRLFGISYRFDIQDSQKSHHFPLSVRSTGRVAGALVARSIASLV